jgi:hypothetical protein
VSYSWLSPFDNATQETIEQLRQDLAKRTQTILGLNADWELAQQVLGKNVAIYCEVNTKHITCECTGLLAERRLGADAKGTVKGFMYTY